MSGPDEDVNIAEQKSHHQDKVGNGSCSPLRKDVSQIWFFNRRWVWIVMILFCLFFWGAAIGLVLCVI